MTQPLVFYDDEVGACPIFVQDEVQPPGMTEQVKKDIKKHGGIVLDDPDAAIVIVITNQKTSSGSLLRARYGGDETLMARKAVVSQTWVMDSIQQQQILGPPDWGGHVIQRHSIQSYFRGRAASKQVGRTQVSVQENHTGILEPSVIIQQPLRHSAAVYPSTPARLDSPQDVPGENSQDNPNQAPLSGSRSSDNIWSQSTRSEGRMDAEGLETSRFSSPLSSVGDTSQCGDRFHEDSAGIQYTPSIHDLDDTLISDPPPKHNEMFRGKPKWTEADTNFLVKYLAWGWRLEYLEADVYAMAAKLMPWHDERSMRNHARSKRELFGNPEKLTEPGQRSQLALAENRERQDVANRSWSYERASRSNDEESSGTESGTDDSDFEQDPPESNSMNDTSSSDYAPSESEDSRDSHHTEDSVNQGTIRLSTTESFGEESQLPIEDKGKGPDGRPNSAVFQAMVDCCKAPFSLLMN
ncbi:hypothetical protein FRC04_001966 [Tulasnella sp. 424]|nr:hypothetical protein FRC04_001966 [Tulasnella sp. 424]